MQNAECRSRIIKSKLPVWDMGVKPCNMQELCTCSMQNAEIYIYSAGAGQQPVNIRKGGFINVFYVVRENGKNTKER